MYTSFPPTLVRLLEVLEGVGSTGREGGVVGRVSKSLRKRTDKIKVSFTSTLTSG